MRELSFSVELEVLTSSVHAELVGVENSGVVKNLASLDLNRLLHLACHHGVIRVPPSDVIYGAQCYIP